MSIGDIIRGEDGREFFRGYTNEEYEQKIKEHSEKIKRLRSVTKICRNCEYFIPKNKWEPYSFGSCQKGKFNDECCGNKIVTYNFSCNEFEVSKEIEDDI